MPADPGCRVCGSGDTRPLPWRGADGSAWARCLVCGSDGSDTDPGQAMRFYDAAYLATHHKLATRAELLESMRSNFDWLDLWAARMPPPERTVLDVGCAEGCGMEGLQARGWAVAGFDVVPEARTGTHVHVAGQLEARLFPRQYGAVLCREVVEHVPDWRGLLAEVYHLLLPGGLFQVQTPRPWHAPDPIPYQREHLQLFAPIALRHYLGLIGYQVLDHRYWPAGQAYLCRRP